MIHISRTFFYTNLTLKLVIVQKKTFGTPLTSWGTQLEKDSIPHTPWVGRSPHTPPN